MNNDTCERCGGSHTGDLGLCDGCMVWLRETPELSEEAVVDAVQFGASPVSSSERIVLVIGSVAVPLLLSLSGITVLLIDVYDRQYNQAGSNAPMGAVFTAFLAVLTTLGAVFYCAMLARRRPWVAAVVALGVTSAIVVPLALLAAMDLREVSISFVRGKGLTINLEDILGLLLVMQIVGVLILMMAALMAAARRRQISSARTRLNAWTQ